MLVKCPPFRAAHLKDPYFRRLSSTDKNAFWKIFNGIEINDLFKDLFEKMTERNPSKRFNVEDIKGHDWFNKDVLTKQNLYSEIDSRAQVVQKLFESL
jgi:serine/threonine protein kinase